MDWSLYWRKSWEWVLIAIRRFLLSAQLWQCDIMATEGILTSGLCPTLIELLQGLFIVHITLDSTKHYGSLNSLEHYICTTSMTNIKPGWVSNPVSLRLEPQPGRINLGGAGKSPLHKSWGWYHPGMKFDWTISEMIWTVSYTIG